MRKKDTFLTVLLVFILSMCLYGCGSNTEDADSSKTKTVATDEYIDVDDVGNGTANDLEKYSEDTTTNTDSKKTDSGNTVGTSAGTSDGTKSNTSGGTNGGASTPSGSEAKYVDEYKTTAVPKGEPTPVEPEAAKVSKTKTYTCTLLIECSTILNNMADFNQDKLSVLPKDGIIYAKKTVNFNEGESVFDVLLRETKNNKIHLEFEMTPMYNSNYVEGINNLYEFDCGELSGWMYSVNSWFPNYGCSRYQIKQNDVIEWRFTCDLGADLGQDLSKWQ